MYLKNLYSKSEFIRASVYILLGFALILIGYVIGNTIGFELLKAVMNFLYV